MRNWDGRLAIVLSLVAILLVLASCSDSTGTTVPRTREQASKALDEALVTLNWAQQDLYRLGGRDIVVSVQIDSALPPHYFRLPRQGVR